MSQALLRNSVRFCATHSTVLNESGESSLPIMTKKILVIEKDTSVCRTLKQHLMQSGYDVVLATEGGDEGILLSVTESPDVILVDTDLSVIDGWQVIKILKTSTVTWEIPVIALAALTTDVDWHRLHNTGCDAYELKPIDHASLLDTIRGLLDPASLFPATVSAVTNTVSEQTVSPKSRVVYVDDSPTDSQAMAEIVQGAGYSYDNIAEPLKALPLLLEIRPKLIFLDLVMPWTNGYEMCAQIRRASAFKGTPIIIVTNNDGIIDRVRARLVGASGFFSKPVNEKRVLKILNKYLVPT